MQWSKYLSFKPELDWSGVVSLVALGLAGLALWQGHSANSPSVQLLPLDPEIATVHDTASSWERLLIVQTVLISNTGGRSVTLIGLSPPAHLPILATLKQGQQVSVSTDLILAGPFNWDWISNPGAIQAGVHLRSEGLTPLPKVIAPGEAQPVYVSVLLEAYHGMSRQIDAAALALVFQFADASRRQFTIGFEIPPRINRWR
jgi:hypothetical protein